MNKTERGLCGECKYYTSIDSDPVNPNETSGICENPKIPVSLTYSYSDPLSALTGEGRAARQLIMKMLTQRWTCYATRRSEIKELTI